MTIENDDGDWMQAIDIFFYQMKIKIFQVVGIYIVVYYLFVCSL